MMSSIHNDYHWSDCYCIIILLHWILMPANIAQQRALLLPFARPKMEPWWILPPPPLLASHLQWQDPWGNCEPSLCLMACFHINGRRKHTETEPPSTIAKPNNKPFPILPRKDCKFHPQLVGLWQPGWNPQRNLISTPDQPGSQVAFKGGLDLTLSVIAWDDDSHIMPVRKPTDQAGS